MKTTTLITRRAAVLTGSAALAAGWGHGRFTGTVRTVGPGQQYATLVEAHAAASNRDLLLCAASCPAQTATISKDVWVDFSQCVWDFTNIPSGSLAGGGKGAIEVFGADIRIYAGEIMGVGLDLPAADLTSAVRVTSPNGDILIVGGYFHNCQNGLTSNAGDASITAIGTRLANCGILADPDHAHNAYFGEMRRVSLINVDSQNPLFAHSIKSRAAEFHASGGVFESPNGACFDLPEGGKFTIENLTMRKLATSGDQKFLTYAVENTNQGLTNANWIKGCYFDLQCPNPYFYTQGGTITLLAGNTANGISPSVVGSGTVIGLPISGGIGVGPDVITANTLTLSATTNVPFSGAAGSFTCNNAAITAGQLTGTVDWGEGGGVVAGVVSGSLGNFTVSGAVTHTYTTPGSKPSVVTVLKETGTPSVTATCTSTMTVSNAAPIGTITATITMSGTPYVFTSNGATDMGDFVDPHGTFTQHCLKATNVGLPFFTVFFRPDVSGGRVEVVFEQGHVFNLPPPDLGVNYSGYNPCYFQNLPAYTAVIVKDGVTLATVSAPLHWWNCRWRWQSAVRPVIRTPAQLMSDGFLPQYSEAANGQTQITLGSTVGYNSWGGPMDLGGVDPYGVAGGDSPHLGFVTAWDSEYICLGNSQALSSTRAYTEGAGAMPWHFRDEGTGAPLDINAYPGATRRGFGGSPALARGVYINGYDGNISHQGSEAYLLYGLTSDPYALEELQFQSNAAITFQDGGWSTGRAYFNYYQSVRGQAWTFRTLAQAARASPVSVPSWLLPKSNFDSQLVRARDYCTAQFVNGGQGPMTSTVFMVNDAQGYVGITGGVESDCGVSCFMEHYWQAMVAAIVVIGYTDWMPILIWHSQFSVSLVSDTLATNGYNRGEPSWYYAFIRPHAGQPYFANIGAMQIYNVNVPNPPYTPAGGAPFWNPGTPSGPAHLNTPCYFPYDKLLYAGLALAVQAGVSSASAGKTWLLTELRVQATTDGANSITRPWSFA